MAGAAGSVPHIYTKGATAYYSRAGWPVGGGGVGQAGGCAARRQGMGFGCAPLPGRWGDAGGALSPKAPRDVWTERTRSLPRGGRPSGPRRRVAAVGRDGVSLSIPRADGLGKKWTERTRSLPRGGRPKGPRRRVRAGDAGSGDAGLRANVSDGLKTDETRRFENHRHQKLNGSSMQHRLVGCRSKS
jgi:hypothetical protein